MASIDNMRSHRARQEIHAERDRLLKGADKRIDLQKFLPSDGKDRGRAILIAAPMSLFGVAPYVGMLLIWFFVYHRSFVQSLVAFASFLVAGGLFCIGSSRQALGRERSWMW